jgi:putative lipoic acid-binding regulatory protein
MDRNDPTGGDRRERALALLDSQHAFPGPFEFRVVIRPDGRPAALGALLAAAGGSERLIEVTERSSERGNYVSLRVKVQLESSAVVLDVYEVLRRVDGILTVL